MSLTFEFIFTLSGGLKKSHYDAGWGLGVLSEHHIKLGGGGVGDANAILTHGHGFNVSG